MPKKSILEQIYTSPAGKAVAKQVGLGEPPRLRRGRGLPTGPVALAALEGAGLGREVLGLLGVTTADAVLDLPEQRTQDEKGRAQPPTYGERPDALVIDATTLRSIDQLELVRQALRPAMKGLNRSGRVIVLATHVDDVDGLEASAVAQALDGIVRTVAKEARGGTTANLILVRGGAGADALRSTIAFLLEGRSAYVDGQVWTVGQPAEGNPTDADPAAGFDGRIVVVTGAARGIGAAIARTFARDGARVVGIDMPQGGDALAKVMNEIKGSALQLDVTAPDAGAKIAAHVARVHGPDAKIWAIVHNAGITRDRMLANLDELAWGQVLAVNLKAEIAINEALLDESLPGGFGPAARIVGIASTSGIAGNKGQTNYAASKGGVIGLVRAEAAALGGRPVTVNAVAPGFIETEMTAAIPFVQREVFRRMNSLGQGGDPTDVAEGIVYLCEPGSGGVTGQVLRVCGQLVVGA